MMSHKEGITTDSQRSRDGWRKWQNSSLALTRLRSDVLSNTEARDGAKKLAAQLNFEVERVSDPDEEDGWYVYSFEF